MLGITVAKERYERWWLGEYCRPTNYTHQPFKKVVKIEMCGPPSFVYGQISFIYEDGTEDIVAGGKIDGVVGRRWGDTAYKPRKCDVEVREASNAKPDRD